MAIIRSGDKDFPTAAKGSGRPATAYGNSSACTVLRQGRASQKRYDSSILPRTCDHFDLPGIAAVAGIAIAAAPFRPHLCGCSNAVALLLAPAVAGIAIALALRLLRLLLSLAAPLRLHLFGLTFVAAPLLSHLAASLFVCGIVVTTLRRRLRGCALRGCTFAIARFQSRHLAVTPCWLLRLAGGCCCWLRHSRLRPRVCGLLGCLLRCGCAVMIAPVQLHHYSCGVTLHLFWQLLLLVSPLRLRPHSCSFAFAAAADSVITAALIRPHLCCCVVTAAPLQCTLAAVHFRLRHCGRDVVAASFRSRLYSRVITATPLQSRRCGSTFTVAPSSAAPRGYAFAAAPC